MRILKYNLPKFPEVYELALPKSAEIISVSLDGEGNPALYVECANITYDHIRTFRIYFTGDQLDRCKHKFLGTLRYRNKDIFYLIHIYEVWQ